MCPGEPLRLQNPSKIIESDTKPCPQMPHLHLNTSRDDSSTSPFQCSFPVLLLQTLRLDGRAGVRVGSASPPKQFFLPPDEAGPAPFIFLTSLILSLTAKSFGGAFYRRGGWQRCHHRPRGADEDKNQASIKELLFQTRLGRAELLQGVGQLWGQAGTWQHFPVPILGRALLNLPPGAQPCCTPSSSTAAGASSCLDILPWPCHLRCGAQPCC